ncbi:uncharacterized protein ACA1_079180 [Acanthamoeba castellanii str. Neff]|uniref:Uncharacterized protein n=1 Tax=Acanthamoeba castellanii (strain ATCC 30010 / Neff) TaxID=1257118 RepID=L8GT80_ACACF|nr:uncharacterized protein ACA1_079180 [Acanthamoeba castellanii str. Neff]ELR15823.1 hypothetical protein ACA1_079180 [Acanthamoeba castellanii str. Neff]
MDSVSVATREILGNGLLRRGWVRHGRAYGVERGGLAGPSGVLRLRRRSGTLPRRFRGAVSGRRAWILRGRRRARGHPGRAELSGP